MSSSPKAANREKLSSEDLLSGYSALFAVKSPDLEGEIDSRVLPIDWLLEFALTEEKNDLSPPESAFIYMSGPKGRQVTIPFDELGDGSQSVPK